MRFVLLVKGGRGVMLGEKQQILPQVTDTLSHHVVSESQRFLLNSNRAIFQIYHDENKFPKSCY
jgi:hypothetical protein